MPNFNDTDYELLSSYLDDALTPTEKAALETRLQADSDLLNELNSLRVVQQAVQSLPKLKAPRNFQLTAPMIGQITPPSKIVALPPRQTSWWVSAAAAVVVAVVGIGLFVANNQSVPSGNQAAQVAAISSATMLPTQTAPLTTASADMARQSTNETDDDETATLSVEAVLADMVPLSTDTNMMIMPGAEPSSPMQPIQSASQASSVGEAETLFYDMVTTATRAPDSAMGGAALSTGASEQQFGATDATGYDTAAADLANVQQQSIAATMLPLPTIMPASTMTANVAGMVAPMQTPTMDAAMSAMVAPPPTMGESMEMAAPVEQADALSDANALSQKGILPTWWRSIGSLVAILQTLYLLLTR